MSGEIIQAKINKGPLSFNMSPIYIEVNGKLVGRCTSASYSHETGMPVVSLIEFKKYDESLNENQMIVLDWLLREKTKYGVFSPLGIVGAFFEKILNSSLDSDVSEAFESLKNAEQFRVLAAFAEWGKQHEPI